MVGYHVAYPTFSSTPPRGHNDQTMRLGIVKPGRADADGLRWIGGNEY